jgi:hypothetical protein
MNPATIYSARAGPHTGHDPQINARFIVNSSNADAFRGCFGITMRDDYQLGAIFA